MNIEFNFTRAKGKFIALCEGDDYWIDADKLQTQVDIHKRYRNITLSCHKALEKNLSEKTEKLTYVLDGCDQFIETEDIVTRKKGYLPTASMMITSDFMQQISGYFKYINPPVGDYFIQIFMAFYGRVYYLSTLTSVYRKNVEGSWSETQSDSNALLNHRLKMIAALNKSWTYFSWTSKANAIAIPWAHYSIGIALPSASCYARLKVIKSFSPAFSIKKTRLLVRYYGFIFARSFRRIKS
ncbi:glycosyltransferase [Methylophaga frappieri]|uniref:Glycosyltransferase n=1 Tax=Methylophaga frappieri (strain ATCC BAA-2434 / DSM 25690 / JAM7) TaxID=754477 RepID=I1YG63_METFJ|nr:glycosyl transferase [Methylophaga frappieri]AFJ01906.1 glycosyltransferase [Methylophaga frappieri]